MKQIKTAVKSAIHKSSSVVLEFIAAFTVIGCVIIILALFDSGFVLDKELVGVIRATMKLSVFLVISFFIRWATGPITWEEISAVSFIVAISSLHMSMVETGTSAVLYAMLNVTCFFAAIYFLKKARAK